MNGLLLSTQAISRSLASTLTAFSRGVFFALIFLTLASCNQTQTSAALSIEDEVVVVTRKGPTTYYETMYGHSGFEYDIAQEFADSLGKPLKVIAVNSVDEVFEKLNNGEAHIAAAGLTANTKRARQYHFSPSYMNIDQYVLYRYGTFRPRKVPHLIGRSLSILSSSSHESTLLAIKASQPEIKWQYSEKNDVLDLMRSLQYGEVEHIIIDSNDYDLYKATFPSIGVAFAIKRQDPLVWMMGPKVGNHTLSHIDNFFNTIEQNGVLETLKERHYGHISHFRRTDSRTFSKKINEKLPLIEDLVKRIALEEGIDWRLLAAISYQESHWNPDARSPTGVRGLMMLTKITASEVGVSKRTDPEQSLRGGARYFHKLYDRLPEDIYEPDRTWMTMAAYNVGYGHLTDARKLAKNDDANPNSWLDVMEYLPLLRKREYYSKTRYGYARGDEPVTYVQRIRNYYEQLAWRERNEDFMIAMAEAANN